MKKSILSFLLVLSGVVVQAQWIINGTGDAVNNNSSGRVGIGTSPDLVGHIVGATGFPAATGASQTGILRLQGTGSNGVLDFSINGGSGATLQVTNRTNLALYYPLLFNPNGGNVGINTTSPITNLQLMDVAAGGAPTGAAPNKGFLISGNSTGGSLNMGIDATGSLFYSWIQSRDRTSNTTYNLALNPTGGNVGIGTTAPSPNCRLDIEGGGLNIGGTGTTDASLHIKQSYGALGRFIQISPSVANQPALNLMASTDASLNYNWWSWGVLSSGSWALQPSPGFGGNSGLFINRSGNVGIGSLSPDQKLTVSGTIHSNEVKVDISVPGPDYVFGKEYKLTSLEDIKTYIDQNKHLPEVPSAKEMEKNGIQLGEMNILLLKKIEELTLYVIEQEKRIQKLEADHPVKKK